MAKERKYDGKATEAAKAKNEDAVENAEDDDSKSLDESNELNDEGDGESEETHETESVYVLCGVTDIRQEVGGISNMNICDILGWSKNRENTIVYGERLKESFVDRRYKDVAIVDGAYNRASKTIQLTDIRYRILVDGNKVEALISPITVKKMKIVRAVPEVALYAPRAYRKFYKAQYKYYYGRYGEMYDFITNEEEHIIHDPEILHRAETVKMSILKLEAVQMINIVDPVLIDALWARYANR